MKKRLTVVTAVILCVFMIIGFSACSGTGDDEEEAFVAATIPVSSDLPVSVNDIIDFYNDIITKVQQNDTFTAENKPGVKTSESLKVGNLKIRSYDPATGEATENDSLAALNKSAKAIKDRILGGIDTSVPVVPFGAVTETTIDDVIYPANSAVMELTPEDVHSAQCYVDGNNLNITFELEGANITIERIFGTRDKAELIKTVNEHSGEYATLNDYTANYGIFEEDGTGVYSKINLSVEMEKNDDDKYVCTGRITTFNISVVADVAAYMTCSGSFADSGDIQVNFRLTDTRSYDFDWLGNANWEPIE